MLGHDRARLVLAIAACTLAIGFTAFAAVYSEELRWCAVTMLAGAVAIAMTCERAAESANRSSRRLPYRAFMLTQHSSHLILLATIGLPLLLTF